MAGIAEAMLAALSEQPVEAVQRLFPAFGKGYATPMAEVRAAVFRDERVLLVRERSDQRWTLPGGFADVGLSVAENVVKETREEAGLDIVPRKLFAVRHKAKHPYLADVRDFYKLFFLCEETSDGQEPVAGYETVGAEFFAFDALPPLSLGRVLEADLKLALAHRLDPALAPAID